MEEKGVGGWLLGASPFSFLGSFGEIPPFERIWQFGLQCLAARITLPSL